MGAALSSYQPLSWREFATARPPVDGHRAYRVAFLAAGVVPAVWSLRHVPLGACAMVGFWTLFAAGVIFVPSAAIAFRRRSPAARRITRVAGGFVLVGAFLFAMTYPATLDARGHIPNWTDVVARGIAFGVQGCVAVAAFRSGRRSRQPGLAVAMPFAAAVAVAAVGAALGERLPLWLAVPLVGAVATLDVLHDRVEPMPLRNAALWFVATASIVGLEARVFTRPGGLVAMAVALVVGAAVITAHRVAYGYPMRLRDFVPAAGLAIVLTFVFTLLMPSLGGSAYLFGIGVRRVPGLAATGTFEAPGRYERWYATTLDEPRALAAASGSFRSPPVSVWDFDPPVGHIFGYRIEVAFWPEGARLPGDARCSTAHHGCVRMAVRRSVNY